MALAVSLWTSLTVKAPHWLHAKPPRGAIAPLTGAALVAGLATLAVAMAITGISSPFLLVLTLVSSSLVLLPPIVLFLLCSYLLHRFAWKLSPAGAAWLALQVVTLLVGWAWTCLFVSEMGMSDTGETIAYIAVAIGVVVAALGLAERIAREAILTHERWQLPTTPLPRAAGAAAFRVSVHLPCYAEPPEIVKETMNRLAAQDYDDFEVLVCDNNTADERLWRPLQEHCRVLNELAGKERFRFFHKAPLPGAKAGALNFCLTVMDPATEVVAVVDADYYARPDFLSRLIPFFADPQVGYVQTPHDYRDFENHRYLTGSYWEYMPNNKVDLPGVSEYGGAFTIGTMCLLRAEVLRAIGGWAEWCLTEDSEVSVRLRAVGFGGIYLSETFGKGLIPDSFDDYKKQRFRWTAGPVQQLRTHWRLFLPSPWAPPMPGWTKFLEVLRCAAPLQTLLASVIAATIFAVTAFASARGDMKPIVIPEAGWIVMVLAALTSLVRTWHRYRLAGCTRVGDMVRGEIARSSLTYVVLVSGLAGLSKKPLAWRRTPKFGTEGELLSALGAALPETLIGAACLVLALAASWTAPWLGRDMAIMTTLGLSLLALRFCAAPYMACLALAKSGPSLAAPVMESVSAA